MGAEVAAVLPTEAEAEVTVTHRGRVGPRAIPVLSEHRGRRIPFILTTALAQPTRQDAPVYRGRKEHRVGRTCSRSRSRVGIQPPDSGSPGLQHPEFWMRRGQG